nr:ribonuclease H-like domain-containing protein [Tanacetum cinerariifolium]
MVLDEVYAPIRSIILTTDPIPDVRGAFATLSRDESYKSTQSYSVLKIGNGNTSFMARTNNTVNNNNNNWSGSNNQPRKLNRPILVCINCNMNGHTADRCFELIGYPSNFKKNTGLNKSSANNNVVSGHKDQTHTFTDDQYKRLMSLISEKFDSSSIHANITDTNCVISFCSSRLFNHNSNISSYKIYIGWIIDSSASQHMTYTIINMFNIVDVSKLNMTGGHPNVTKALVTHIGSIKLINNIVIHNVLVVPGYQVNLLFVHSLSKDNKFRVIFDKDTCVILDSVLRTQVGIGNESNGLYFLNIGASNDSIPEAAICEDLESAIIEDNNLSEGDDTDYQEFNNQFQNQSPQFQNQSPVLNPDRQNENLRRSTRKTSMPAKLSDFELDINNAFSYGELAEDVYMTLLEGIEVLESKGNLYLTQRKYCLEVLAEFGIESEDSESRWTEEAFMVLLESI